MQADCTQIPYQLTGYFSKIATDYLEERPAIRPFYQHSISIEGIKAAIATARQGRAGRQRNTRKRASTDAAAYDPDDRSPQPYDTRFKMPILHRIRMIFIVEFGRPSRRVLKAC